MCLLGDPGREGGRFPPVRPPLLLTQPPVPAASAVGTPGATGRQGEPEIRALGPSHGVHGAGRGKDLFFAFIPP